MPATEQTWRDLKAVHVIFGVTSVGMLIATIWMLAADHTREWKGYQRKFRDIETWVADARVVEEQTNEYANEHEALVAKLSEARATVPEKRLLDDFKKIVQADAERRKATPYDFTEFDKIYASLPDLVSAAKEARQASDKAADAATTLWKQAVEAGEKALKAEQEGAFDQATLRTAADNALTKAQEARKVSLDADRTALDKETAAGDARDKLLAIMRTLVTDTKRLEDRLAGQVKFKQADLNQALSNFDLGVGEGKPQTELDSLQKHVNEITKARDDLIAQQQDSRIARTELERILKEVTGPEDRARKALEDHAAMLGRLQTALEERAPNLGKRILESPVLDAFGRPLKVEQIWLPKLTINNNFRDVPRFDRCITCHQAIDKTLPGSAIDGGYPVRERELVKVTLPALESRPEPGLTPEGKAEPLSPKSVYGMEISNQGLVNSDDVTIRVVWPNSTAASVGLMAGDTIEMIGGVKLRDRTEAENRLVHGREWKKPLDIQVRRGLPNPFASHPRLDLFVGSLSPHPLGTMGCTECHDGQGSGTAFQWTSHTPNDPNQAKQWSKDHGWSFNHHWIFPMYPRRFAESTCLKCHHQVVELEASERFPEPPAEKLVHGYELIRRYGCFGCHEINGFDGPNKRVGPDLRLEPAFAAAAQQLRADPNFSKLDQEQRAQVEQLIQHPENDTARRLVREMLLAEKAAADKAAVDPQAAQPVLSASTIKLEAVLKDVETPGQLRKVGPSLRHLASKVDFNWLYSWISNPTEFRPSTRMPRFFGLWEHLEPVPERDEHGNPVLDAQGNPKMTESGGLAEAKKFEPIEIRAAAEFLLANSQPFEYLTQPTGIADEPVAEKAARGKTLFERRGCLACHSHSDFPNGKANQGPDLSRIGAKLNGNRNGALWLYSWVRDPQRYHNRTVMPNLFLEPITLKDGKKTDPAEDITLYLLGSQQGWTPTNVPPRQISADEKKALNDLALQYLSEKFPARRAEQYLKTGIPESRAGDVKGDEALLIVPDNAQGRDVETKVVQYVGRRTISKYGCAGCHDIPGFEDSKPIGTALADWGRKDPAKLAFEQIWPFIASSTHEESEAGKNLDREYYLEKLQHHEREGFIWQKLRAPRSYDFKKTENKRYNERLRMPKFPFNDEEREAVITFVLGLVAEPPAPQYVYHATPRRDAIVKGRVVLEKFNCGGCHTLEMDRWQIAFPPDTYGEQTANPDYAFLAPHFTPEEIDVSKRTDHRGLRHATLVGMPLMDDKTGQPFRYDEEGSPIAPDDTTTPAQFKFTLWKDTLIDGHPWIVKATDPLVPQSRILPGGKSPPVGGDFARLIWPGLAADARNANPPVSDPQNVWGFLPPPLLNEGRKVQSKWLHDFLLDPYPIRPTVVLRMPKFNMSSNEASQLVDYFAAMDGAEYPYHYDPHVREAYLAHQEDAYKKLLAEKGDSASRDRLGDAMKIVTSNDFCVKCHKVGDFTPQSDPNSLAPNLADVSRRLRPDFVKRWIANPARLLPYTVMPVNIKPSEPVGQNLFVGTNVEQIEGLVDLLMNFNQFLQRSVRPLVKPSGTPPAAASAGAEE